MGAADEMNIISLQGDMYGYKMLPKVISGSTYDEAFGNASADVVKVAKEWYHLDTSNIPEVYLLKSLESLSDDNYWNVVYPTLITPLAECTFLEDNPSLFVNRSVTEWETRTAIASNSANGDDSSKRCFWSHRKFEGGISEEQDTRHFLSDLNIDGNQGKLDMLKQEMKLNISNVAEYSLTVGSFNAKDREYHLYLRVS